MTSPQDAFGPLRPSQIKWAIYGKGGGTAGRGLRFQRVLYAGWSFYPAPGIVAKDIYKLGLDLKNFRLPLVTAIKTIMERSIWQNFESGGRPQAWEPLAQFTVDMRNGATGPILIRSGALQRVASSFEVWTINDNDASIRSLPSEVWYGNLHQSGYGSIGATARRLLGGGASAADVESLSNRLSMGLESQGARAASKQSKFVIPQREFAMFQEEDIEAIQEIFIEWMERRADQVGRGWAVRF
jgi:phage gpG-like protein